MARFSDPQTLRRWTAGCCLLAAPVLYVAGLVADPAIRDGGDAVGVYGAFPGHVAGGVALLGIRELLGADARGLLLRAPGARTARRAGSAARG
jgi:hypothetical protein